MNGLWPVHSESIIQTVGINYNGHTILSPEDANIFISPNFKVSNKLSLKIFGSSVKFTEHPMVSLKNMQSLRDQEFNRFF